MNSRLEELHIRNIHQVNPWLFRGGQPDGPGLRELHTFGIRTVISFRWNKSVNEWEREACERIGLKFYSIPLNYMTLPKASHIDHLFSLFDELSNRPVFVHCFHGSDRTGLLIGIYRIARDGWTVHEAYKEMKTYGFHRFRIRPFKWCLWRYYANHLKVQKTIDSQRQETKVPS